jgi:hypothetical protein
MLAYLLVENHPEKTHEQFTYRLTFPKRQVILECPRPFESRPVWELVLKLSDIRETGPVSFKEPFEINGFKMEKEDHQWLIMKLSGIKNPPQGRELAFAYTKLDSNYFSILEVDRLLENTQMGEMVQYMLTNQLFSYQMLFTLFDLLEKRFQVSSFISQRVYQEFLKEVQPFAETLENDKRWQMLTIFISNFHYYRFLKDKYAIPDFFDFLHKIRKQSSECFFDELPLNKLIRREVDPRKISSFLSTVPDLTLARAMDALEWEQFKPMVSSRTFKRIQEDIWVYFDKEQSYRYKLETARFLVQWMAKKSPPFYYLNQGHTLKSELNLIFDRVGPFYTAIFLQETEPLQKDFLPFFTPFRKGFVQGFLSGKIKKRGGIGRKDLETARNRFNYYLTAALSLPEIWFLLEETA